MIIVVLSQNQEMAKRLWKDKLSQRFSGYQHVKFNPKLLSGLDGFDLTRMIFVYAGGYSPRNADESRALAYYIDNGAMAIDANDYNFTIKQEYLGQFYNKPLSDEELMSEAEYMREVKKREQASKQVNENDPLLFDKDVAKSFLSMFKGYGDDNDV